MNIETRSNKWLKDRFKYLCNRYFPDIEILNNIIIKFGRPCKTRLGSIKKGRAVENFNSIITINGHLRDTNIPGFVIDAVLSHEFMHYAHGFNSPHKQKHLHPHQGGVVDNELKDRGLADILLAEKKWIKSNWPNYIKKNHKQKSKNIFRIFLR